MKGTIYISGIIGKETTLSDVIRQFKSFTEPSEVDVVIHSEGGDVEQGDAMFDYLQGIKKTIPVNTITDKAYSISAKIFSVGEKRVVEDIDKAIMIHFAWATVSGKAEKLEIIAEALRELENDFAGYYSEFLDIDETTVRSLLDNDTFISGADAIALGFATELKTETKAVAQYEPNNYNLKTSKMSKSKNRILNAFKAFLDNEVEVNALVLQDSTGKEIEFADLEEGATPKEGDTATIDGEAIQEGEFIMPSLEGKIVVFSDGKVSEIKDAEVEDAEEDAVEVNAEVIKEVLNWEIETSSTSFNEGDVLEYEYEGETYSFGVGEYYIPSIGKSVVTDATGTIVKVKESASPDTTTVEEDAEVSAQEQVQIEAVLEKLTNKISTKFEAKFTAQEEKIKKLNKLLGSKEFNAQEEEVETSGTAKKSSQNYLTSVLHKGRKR